MGDAPWPLSDGVVTIRPLGPGEAEILVAGRDPEWERWLGPGDLEPHPTACVVVNDQIVGWVDFDPEPKWLGPGEVNIGYNVFAPHRRQGYASRAVRLLLQHLRNHTNSCRANLVIDQENAASRGVARSVGAVEAERMANEAGRTQIRYVVDLCA
jgi:RimJ/RimL family protein N-acetyltransferase